MDTGTVINMHSPPQMQVEFRNQRGYYIGNAFLPSLLLSIVCYLSFYFAIDDFQDRVMVSLTSLLVLTSLLTQTNQSIPKTAYLKLIDIWYIVLICLDFLIIVVLVFIESLRRRVQTSAVSSGGSQIKVKSYGSGSVALERQELPKDHVVWRKGMFQQPENKYHNITQEDKARKVNQISILVFPIIIVCFLGVFFYNAFVSQSR
nr:glycine receptor subunit alphaZ1-like [Procambarus clarkii]